MAYLNFLVSAPERQVNALRKDASVLLRPSLVVAVSHLVGYWVEVQPLGEILGEAIDGGETVNEQLRHPLRAPTFHPPEPVRSLHQRLRDAWQKARGPQTEGGDWGWYREQISEVLRAFGHASTRGECIVSVLEVHDGRLPFRTDVSSGGADDWPVWVVVGSVAGAGLLGALGLCYWRHRRFTRRRT